MVIMKSMSKDLLHVRLSFKIYITGFRRVFHTGLTGFYSELMKGLGASTRLFQLQAKQPLIPISGK